MYLKSNVNNLYNVKVNGCMCHDWCTFIAGDVTDLFQNEPPDDDLLLC